MPRKLTIGIGVAVAVLLAVLIAWPFGDKANGERGTLTTDRMTHEQQEQLVAGPMKKVMSKNLAGGKAELEQMLQAEIAAHGPATLRGADLLEAFGAELTHTEHKAEAIEYLARAIDAYRAAAPDSAEVAVALQSYADVLVMTAKDGAPDPAALAAAQEALAIRQQVLRPDDAETGAAMALIAELKGHPAVTGRNPAKVAAAAALAAEAAELLARSKNANEYDAENAWLRRAKIYARNGLGPETIKAASDYRRHSDGRVGFGMGQVADELEKAGDPGNADFLRGRYGLSRSTDLDEEPLD